MKLRSGKVGKIGNPRSRAPSQPVSSSRILMAVMGCFLVGAACLFGTSLHFMTQSQASLQMEKSIDHHHFEPLHVGIPSKEILERAGKALQEVKLEFFDRYGGQMAAQAMQEKAITLYGSLEDTADRILRAIAQQDEFVMGFAGYSITVGRGNFFNQSFPFVVERVLKGPMKALGVPTFTVRNSAIGGIPSFPYAYCLDHFVSRDTDILSWDFSMNEKSKDPAVFEAYVRQALHQLPKQPMIIMVDNNPLRSKLLEDYVQKGLLKGALTLAKAESVVGKANLEKPDNQKPRGLQQWDQFGAPDGCPGKGAWHPKMREHEFMGWMIAMHFIEALDLVYQTQQKNPKSWYKKYANDLPQPRVVFPNPLSKPDPNDASATEILFGHKVSEGKYQMKELSCRTNFLPATDKDKQLDTLVVSGMNKQATAGNIMDSRSDDYYQKGWVLDVSEVERQTKRKVENCGGLGYIDMKIALYGIPESGPLELFLPHEGEELHDDHDHDAETTSDAQHWFDGIIVCEANDKRPNEACQLDRDLEFEVGGEKVTSVAMINGAGEYLKRKTCVSVGVPKGAQTSQRKGQLGLQVKIAATGAVTRKAGACCLSHVVWEQH